MIIPKRHIIHEVFTISLIFIFITGCGTLGGIGDNVYFPTSKKMMGKAIDSLYDTYPEYKMPVEWKKYDDWSARGYDFLESRMFYFKSSPEEMYYVTFIGDSVALQNPFKIGIGIQAVCPGNDNWLLEKDLNSKQKERIEKRFKTEIVSKLEIYTKTNSFKD